MASEAMLTVLALVIIVVCVSALLVSVFYSIPYALRRVRLYPEPGARRTFAVLTLVGILAPTVVVVIFLMVGVIAITVDDPMLRSAILRPLLLIIVMSVAAQVALVPVGHRQVEEQAKREADDREERRVSRRLDAAERESEDRYSEGEVEKTEVRRRLDIQEEEVKGTLDAQEGRVLQRLDAQDAKVSGKLDEMLDILRRGRR